MMSNHPYLRVFILIALPIMLAAGFIAATRAQEATPESTAEAPIPRATVQSPRVAIPTTLLERIEARSGPGDTYAAVGWLAIDTSINVMARNPAGNWVMIFAESGGENGQDITGWVMTGFVDNADLQLSLVPAWDVAPADVTALTDPNLARLYAVPIIPQISEAMQVLYNRGQMMGNTTTVVKIGDSNSANPYYLTPLNTQPVTLGAYDFLQTTVNFFAPAVPTESIAARVGLNAYSLFDAAWADPAQCESGETPLMCEYRVRQPAIAIVMFGPNDIRALNSERYREQMERLVQETLSVGIIPVLTTFSSNEADEDLRFQALRFNLILIEVANTYQVPLINLWAAARALPNYGIGGDGVHMTVSGGRIDFSAGQEARYGVSLQNLLVLVTLDEIRRAVGME
jgi:GDSL-like Lipase/Acylhydrolase family